MGAAALKTTSPPNALPRRYDLDYLDGSKETGVDAEFVQVPKKRTVGWNPGAAKQAAEKRKESGEAAPTALGSDPTAGLKLRAIIEAEEAAEAAKAAAAASPANATAKAVLMVLTSNNVLGESGEQTGWYLPEVKSSQELHPKYTEQERQSTCPVERVCASGVPAAGTAWDECTCEALCKVLVLFFELPPPLCFFGYKKRWRTLTTSSRKRASP